MTEKRAETTFYKRGAEYWANIPATIDGVLGGYGQISDTDIAFSKKFLDGILASDQAPGTNLALDCGAGIGRVAKHLLMPRFQKVDLVEQDEKFVNTAKQSIDEDNKLGSVYLISLQHFKPEKPYDVVWCQWVLGHLNNNDLITFLERCALSLSMNGIIVIKENISSTNETDYDEHDYSVTRPLTLMHKIFQESKLRLVKTAIQPEFPEDLYPVYTFALVPESRI